MSKKIKIGFIIQKHLTAAVCDAETKKIDWSDFFIFIVTPFVLSGLFYWLEISDKSGLINLLMSVSSIFAGLLLNLLVLVYDQNKRVQEKLTALNVECTASPNLEATSLAELMREPTKVVKTSALYAHYARHAQLLSELLSSISYAILISLFSIVTGIVSYLLKDKYSALSVAGKQVDIDYKVALISVSIFFSLNLLLTVLMIVKRVYKLISSPG
ncbi:Permease of the drug/metabolite transporter (DMT) superfamily [Pseudomonas chlororaphis subsp. aurantiaca]|uniref:hypothetical protein n=1 Tax=Pseudomonas chlororaphis TaxID=587753 RepID=UPI000F55AF5A|nr:hypothetical protein [Pseudomonas chlororaphis]AZD34648.1 Permease of the drug/metabolite transporter (DMT) superfamily [Pseudomonas chlororaphis subsp. aurantiaca]AZD40983.1 Permease of the drug/metabolite transporter (DMT) superfamily [Pseudomonas chlororaphis subsp. aurantiaca]